VTVRLSGCQYLCECGNAMAFLEPMEPGLRRRMACEAEGCYSRGTEYIEPLLAYQVFPVESPVKTIPRRRRR